ncbi:hypothetical protein R1flu_014329 [Riccia fluitans]|uniref:Maspardin n=1 Tax=Riccia fluitans TaxID=41844 RepID=A0ABD1YFT6_9MARC
MVGSALLPLLQEKKEVMYGCGSPQVDTSFVPQIGTSIAQWAYYYDYDYGLDPKIVAPILSLSAKGYRVIAADSPPVRSHQEWVSSFEKFLDTLGVHHVHLYGTSLGDRLVRFTEGIKWASFISWTPEFVLKRYILSGIRDGPQEPLIADSIDFVVGQLETLSRDELASRLSLNTTLAAVGQLPIPDSAITVMDTNDYCAVPQVLKDQVSARYPGARRAHLKTGGDFPFLSRAGEVTLHLQLHLMRAGVEGQMPTDGKPLVLKDANVNSAGTESMKDSGGPLEDVPLRGRGGTLRRLDDPSSDSNDNPLFRNSGLLDSVRETSQEGRRWGSFSDRDVERPEILPRSWSNNMESAPQSSNPAQTTADNTDQRKSNNLLGTDAAG